MTSRTESTPLRVEVAYALPDRQALVALEVADGTTVQQAIEHSGIAEQFPESDLRECAVGVWGHVAQRQQLVRDGDRIEIYRSLAIEPREARRRLALAGKTMGKPADD